ncbi:hypothetical protein CXB51_006677 [Gossypium anomalum]|uniref:Uncharacterized protein n=1 Tax=Gossypium anomalum TaxID=47600 RepID=A0A8J6D8T5_9ROSI|nr:hypothetical protein CXB51_006677 [Gossypium anomalum]
MMDIWSWICELPNNDDWGESDPHPPLAFTMASSEEGDSSSTGSIQLKAERTMGSDSEVCITFTISFQGFQSSPLWVSDPCPLSSEQPFLPLVLQLLQETISRSPAMPNTICPRSQLQKLKPEPISWIIESHSPESFSSFFNLVLLTRLFWLCSWDAPSEIGSFYFQYLLGPNIEALTFKQVPVLRTFLVSIGVDTELCFMRTLGYMLTKWIILSELSVGLKTLITPVKGQQQHLGFSYATEAHGFWTLKGYAPINAMKLLHSSDQKSQFPATGAKGSLLRYALAHQQLEAVIQLEYTIGFHDGYIQVNARVDNLRFHVARLGFSKKNDEMDDFLKEKHFPSRIRVWVGPEVGSTYVSGLTLGRSTNNGENEVETQRILKGSFGKYSKDSSHVKARARVSMKNKMKNWRWDQDAEGNAAVFDAVLCDNVTGHEIATWKSFDQNSNGSSHGFQHRYYGANRPFTKAGGLVFAGDDYGEGVGWRLNRDMDGSVLKWRIGGEVWLSYWPNNVRSTYAETRCVEWCDEVDLPLIPPGK